MESAGCLFSRTLATEEVGALVATREKSIENLLNFYSPSSDSGIDWQFRLEPASIPWKWRSGGLSYPAFRFVRQAGNRIYFETEKNGCPVISELSLAFHLQAR